MLYKSRGLDRGWISSLKKDLEFLCYWYFYMQQVNVPSNDGAWYTFLALVMPEVQLSAACRHFSLNMLRTSQDTTHIRKPELFQTDSIYKLKWINRIHNFSSWKLQRISYSTISRFQAFEEVQSEAVLKLPFHLLQQFKETHRPKVHLTILNLVHTEQFP